MLRSEEIGDGDGFVEIGGVNGEETVLEDVGETVAGLKGGGAAFDFREDAFKKRVAGGDKEETFLAGAVLGLREEVEGDPSGIRGGVGEDEDFAGARKEVGAGLAEELALSLIHI